MRNRMVRTLGVSLTLTAFLFTTSGCFGGFNLTRNVYNFNKRVSPEKWVQELVFLGLVIVPVYGIAMLVDAIIINSIEFWTGNNPVTVQGKPETRVVEHGDVRLVQTMTATPERRTMVIEEYRKGELARTITSTLETGESVLRTTVRYPDGRVETYSVARHEDGSATIDARDADGRASTRLVSAADVERLTERVHDLAAVAASRQVASAASRPW